MWARCERGNRKQLPAGITGSRGAASSVWSGGAATLRKDSFVRQEKHKKTINNRHQKLLLFLFFVLFQVNVLGDFLIWKLLKLPEDWTAVFQLPLKLLQTLLLYFSCGATGLQRQCRQLSTMCETADWLDGVERSLLRAALGDGPALGVSVFQYLDVLHTLLAQLLKPAGRRESVLKTQTHYKLRSFAEKPQILT